MVFRVYPDEDEASGLTRLAIDDCFVAVTRGLAIEVVKARSPAAGPDAATTPWLSMGASAAASTRPMPPFLYRSRSSEPSDDIEDVVSAVAALPEMAGDVVMRNKCRKDLHLLSPAALLLSALLTTDVSLLVVTDDLFAQQSVSSIGDEIDTDEDDPSTIRHSTGMHPNGEALLRVLACAPVAAIVALDAGWTMHPKLAARFLGALPSFRQDQEALVAAIKAVAPWPLSHTLAWRLSALFPDATMAKPFLATVPYLAPRSSQPSGRAAMPIETMNAAALDRVATTLVASLGSQVSPQSDRLTKMVANRFEPELVTCDRADLLFDKDRAPALLKASAKIALAGLPGTGKSEAAVHASATMGCTFEMVQPSSYLAHKLGLMERRLAAIFRKARDHGNTVLIFDEFDSVGSSRQNAGSASYIISLTNSMLMECDRHNLPIFFITNYFDRIDDALRRRMDVVATFSSLSDDKERLAYKIMLGIDVGSAETIGDTVVSDFAHARKTLQLTEKDGKTAGMAAVRSARDVRLGDAGRPKRMGFF